MFKGCEILMFLKMAYSVKCLQLAGINQELQVSLAGGSSGRAGPPDTRPPQTLLLICPLQPISPPPSFSAQITYLNTVLRVTERLTAALR